MATSKALPAPGAAVKTKRVRNKVAIPQMIREKFIGLTLIDKAKLVKLLNQDVQEHRAKIQAELDEAMGEPSGPFAMGPGH